VAFSQESRMKSANASNLHRKSGAAQWRDLRFLYSTPLTAARIDTQCQY
jgi:hypothetical protein